MSAKVTIRKYMGDDAYSWAVFVDGRVVRGYSGLTRQQGTYYKGQVEAQFERDRIKREKAIA